MFVPSFSIGFELADFFISVFIIALTHCYAIQSVGVCRYEIFFLEAKYFLF